VLLISMPLYEWCSLQDAADYLTDKLDERWTKDDVLGAGEKSELFVKASLVRSKSSSAYYYSYKVEVERLKEYVGRRIKDKKNNPVSASQITANWQMAIQVQAAVIWRKYRAMAANPTKNSIKVELARWCRDNKIITGTGINPSEDYIYRHVLRHWTPPTD